MADEKFIQFVANYDDWVAVKKLKVENATEPRTVMEFLAGLYASIDAKVEANLRKIVELDKLDAVLKEEVRGGKSEEELANALKALNGRKVGSVIKELSENEAWQKNEQKEVAGFCKAYATKKALAACGLSVDYSGIEIPGMKRVMKGAKKLAK